MNMKLFRLPLTGTLALVLSACAPADTMQAMKKMGKIMMDPKIPIGENKQQPSEVSITIYAEANANRSEYGDAPIDIWVFQLSEPDELNEADLMSLIQAPKEALSTSYLKHTKKQVKPGESAIIVPFKLVNDTNYIGVVAAYANIDKTQWKAVERVKTIGEKYSIFVPVTKKAVSIQIHR